MESHLAQLLVVQHLPAVKQKGRLHHALVDSEENKERLNVVFVVTKSLVVSYYILLHKSVRYRYILVYWFDDLKA
jgi:hypothetical protein